MIDNQENDQPEVVNETNTVESAADQGVSDMSDEQLAEAKRYGRQQLVCDLADRFVDLAYLAIAALLLARPLDVWLSGFGQFQSRWLRLVALYVIITCLHAAVSFPLSYFSGHVLEHRYKLSRQSFARWLWRYGKRNGLALALGTLMLMGLYAIIWWTHGWWWLVAAAAFFVVSVVMGQLAPVLILPLFYKISRLEDEALADRFQRLSTGTGLAIEGVYRMEMSAETAKANAMLAGLGNTRRVILGDTLLKDFTPDEIEVIFAHEVGHHVHHHIRKIILAGVFYSAAGFYLCDRIVVNWVGWLDGEFDYAAFPVWTVPVMMMTISVFSSILEPLQNGVSRRFERASDRYALERTGFYEAYRSAFQKLARLNKADPDPHPLEVFLFHSHPPIRERLLMADQVK